MLRSVSPLVLTIKNYFYPSKTLNDSKFCMRSSIGGESRPNKSLIESLVQLFGMIVVVLRRGGGFIRGSSGSPRQLKKKDFVLIISHFYRYQLN